MGHDEDDDGYSFEERRILEEVEAESGSSNPLVGKVTRVYFVSRSNGKGRKPRKRLREVEMVSHFKGRFKTVGEDPKNGLDSLAEELIPLEAVPPHVNPYQYFLDLFRELPIGRQKRG